MPLLYTLGNEYSPDQRETQVEELVVVTGDTPPDWQSLVDRRVVAQTVVTGLHVVKVRTTNMTCCISVVDTRPVSLGSIVGRIHGYDCATGSRATLGACDTDQ